MKTNYIFTGIQFVDEAEKNKKYYDIIILDVDSKNISSGMSCPPEAFLENKFLLKLSTILSEQGMLQLNLVCRSESKRNEVMEKIRKVFPVIYEIKMKEHVNKVIYIFKSKTKFSTIIKAQADKANAYFASCTQITQNEMQELLLELLQAVNPIELILPTAPQTNKAKKKKAKKRK